MIAAITEGIISTVHGVGRILYLRPFNEHVGTSVTDGPNIQDIVRGSRAFRTTSAEIRNKVEADFAEAEVSECFAFDSTRLTELASIHTLVRPSSLGFEPALRADPSKSSILSTLNFLVISGDGE